MTHNSDKLLPKDLETLFPDFSEDGDAEWIAEHLERKGKPVIIIEGFETKEQAIQFWCDMGSSCVENRVLKEFNTRPQPTPSDSELVESEDMEDMVCEVMAMHYDNTDSHGVYQLSHYSNVARQVIEALKPYLKGGAG